jgi:hypothetical protein
MRRIASSDQLQRAIQIAPDYATAYGGLAENSKSKASGGKNFH